MNSVLVTERQLSRWIWSQALAEQWARHARGEPYASYVDMAKWLTAWCVAQRPVGWPKARVSPAAQALDEAYQRFFKKTGGFPHFKKYGDDVGIDLGVAAFAATSEGELIAPLGALKKNSSCGCAATSAPWPEK